MEGFFYVDQSAELYGAAVWWPIQAIPFLIFTVLGKWSKHDTVFCYYYNRNIW